jgi:ribonuclease P protein component
MPVEYHTASKCLLKRPDRLKKRKEFLRVRQYGKSFAHPLIVLLVAPNEINRTRTAVSANRYTGNAVQRNRLKRRLREIMRPLLNRIASGYDLIIIVRKNAAKANYHDLHQAVVKMLDKAGLLK